ncbi:hypothetical protein CYMTET_41314 [Cymbomonas tetramitiformis]|uniref:Uncharacterized protein n=1 Tax=Cymbomonas tetramitiformis TaxID=36881 RepID=A0AAE0C6C7_9CHLO|nr:hypothetical protein CYMTET_44659 [Cymbomonas tetramitiformis]KAK3248883.1 hypothetical protein CYMTET_41669 [Cymbomonas tetramitiformis]KAK3249238.1 hypothetical protein CYMTET_41314 [Cymbomonas tetramitiformis]
MSISIDTVCDNVLFDSARILCVASDEDYVAMFGVPKSMFVSHLVNSFCVTNAEQTDIINLEYIKAHFDTKRSDDVKNAYCFTIRAIDHADASKRTIMFFALIKYIQSAWVDKVVNLRGSQKRVDSACEFEPATLEIKLLCKLNHNLRPSHYVLNSKCMWNLLRMEIKKILTEKNTEEENTTVFDTAMVELTAINDQVRKLYQKKAGFRTLLNSEDEMRVKWKDFERNITNL